MKRRMSLNCAPNPMLGHTIKYGTEDVLMTELFNHLSGLGHIFQDKIKKQQTP